MARKYRHAWGVGRHLLGSQIFDYWRDPWGQKHEHYADGDLFDVRQPPGYHILDRAGLYQWGPDLPDDFIDARLTPRRLVSILKTAMTDRPRLKKMLALKGKRVEARAFLAMIAETSCPERRKNTQMAVKNLSDIMAIEATPLIERGLPESTYAALVASAKRTPDRAALTFFLSADGLDETHVWTYADLISDVTRAANVLASLGVATHRPVAIVLPNLPETHFAIWGGEAAGAALVINPMLEPKQIGALMRSARASVLVTLTPALNPKAWPSLAAELALLPDLTTIAVVDMAGYLASEKREASGVSIRAPVSNADLKVVNFRDAMRQQPSDRLIAGRNIRAGDISSYVCTGGTTGAPKIAMRTHRNEVFDAWAALQLLEGDGSARAILCGLPLFHVNGQLVTGLQPWMRGDHVVLATPEGYRGKNVIARFWEIVARFRVSTFSGVPTLYAATLDTPIGDNDLSSLKFAICGAAPMPLALIRAFESRTGVKIVEGYGLTEGGCVSSLNPLHGETFPGSIGLPIPYQHMAPVILDADGRFERMAEPDEIGVIAINGPNVFSGYLDPRHNKGLWIDIEGQRWLNTGDLGRKDSQGLLLAGRAREGAHYPRRAQHRSEDHRGCFAEASGGRNGRGGRKPRLLRRRVASCLCSIEARARRDRGGTHGACRPDHSGEGGGPQTREDFVGLANDRGGEAFQARAGRT